MCSILSPQNSTAKGSFLQMVLYLSMSALETKKMKNEFFKETLGSGPSSFFFFFFFLLLLLLLLLLHHLRLLQIPEHHAVWPEDLFELSNNFDAPNL